MRGFDGTVDNRERREVIIRFRGDTHPLGQQASPAPRRMMLEVEFSRLQGGVALRNQFPADCGEPRLQVGEQAFRPCARSHQIPLWRMLLKTHFQSRAKCLYRHNRTKQHAPRAVGILRNGDACLMTARVYR